MMNNVIVIPLNGIVNYSDSLKFNGTVSFDLYGFSVVNTKVVIDTGCGYSVFNYKKIFGGSSDSEYVKRVCLENNLPVRETWGVESGGNKHQKAKTIDEFMNSSATKIKVDISDFDLCGARLPVDSIHMNFDRQGNNLIGIDILHKLDSHIGISLIDSEKYGVHKGQYVFVACADKKNLDYNLALASFFELSHLTAQDIVNEFWRQHLSVR